MCELCMWSRDTRHPCALGVTGVRGAEREGLPAEGCWGQPQRDVCCCPSVWRDRRCHRPLKKKSRLRGSGSLGQMSVGNNMGFMNDPVGGEGDTWVFGLSVPLK